MKYLTILILLFVATFSHSQSRILVDGIFDEWADYPVIYSDAIGDNGSSGVDFKELQIYNDDEFIFFLIETGSEINLQDLNEISIYLDTDNNANTGESTNGIGAELIYSFGNRSGLYFESGGSSLIGQNTIGLVSAPTVTSDRFEIAIRRNSNISGTPIFQSDNLNIVFRDNSSNGDFMPSLNQEITYTFLDDDLEPLPDYSIQKHDETDLRIISYNVLNDGLFDQSRLPSFTRILQAINPDIIGFQEIYDHSSAQVANQVESILPSSSGQQWYHAKAGPDCHAISKYPILESALIPGYNQNAGNGAFLIDVPGIETSLLFIVAHPPCCGNNEGRQIEVDLIMKFLRDAKEGNGPIPIETDTPILIVGDMNLVGDNRQLETLLTGNIFNETSYGPDFNPDWDGNNLLDSKPFITGLPFNYTWYSAGSSFSPGKLDYIIYSGSNLLLHNSFSLFTPSLSQDSLSTFNLFANDVLAASDHLPIVTDFELKNLTSIKNPLSKQELGILNIYPNPANEQMDVSISVSNKNFVTIQLIDQLGKTATILHRGNLNSGEHKFTFNIAAFPPGIYWFQIKNSEFTDSKKIIIFK